jgi:hypothetical protein
MSGGFTRRKCRKKLAEAEAWMKQHPPKESDIELLESQLSGIRD